MTIPQAKICGLTLPDEAAACAAMGASAIGLVFYPPSPRHVAPDQARRIQQALPAHIPAVGVFVNPDLDDIRRIVATCNLGAVQLHGNETPEWVARLRDALDVPVFKALFATREPAMDRAPDFSVDAFLVEAGKGVLPGGNAETWDWAGASDFAARHTTILAGGLQPANVHQAIADCLPAAVDASSGLESAPGRKDLQKVKAFLDAVVGTAALYQAVRKTIQPVFNLRPL